MVGSAEQGSGELYSRLDFTLIGSAQTHEDISKGLDRI